MGGSLLIKRDLRRHRPGLPSWVSGGGERLFSQASELASTPYQPYGGPRVAEYGADFDTARGDLEQAGAST